MLGVLLAFASSIFWGASDFAGGVSSRRSSALVANLWSFVSATAVSVIALVVYPGGWSHTAVSAGVWAGVLGLAGFLTLYASLAAAPMGVATVIVGATEAVIPVVVGVFWYREGLTAFAWAGVAVAMAGAALIGVAEGGQAHARWGSLLLAAVSGAFFGFSVVALDAAPADSGFVTAGVEIAVGLVLMVLLTVAVSRVASLRRASSWVGIGAGNEEADARTRGIAMLAGLFLAVANLLLLIALREAPLAVVGVVLCLYPVTTALLARIFLEERLTLKHIAGIAVALAGCVLLALS
ncbi:EamA family transporter [Demequina sp.]|uniref:EamA family transporter n=1 Tax=Demequina sp. TaxID=2050685 RepID=UPI003D0E738F